MRCMSKNVFEAVSHLTTLLKIVVFCWLITQMVKNSSRNVGDLGLIPGLGRSPGEGNGNPLQYSCLEYSMDRGVWHAAIHEIAKSQTRLSN